MISAFFRTAKIIKNFHVLFMYISAQATCLTRNISLKSHADTQRKIDGCKIDTWTIAAWRTVPHKKAF